MDQILDLVAQNRLEEALDKLYEVLPPVKRGQLVILRNKLGELDRKVIVGTLTHSEESVERSKIIDAMLKLHAKTSHHNSMADADSSGIAPAIPNTTDTTRIYFSYSWKDTPEDQQSKVNQLYDSLKSKGYNVLVDKEEIQYGASIKAYMEELGRGDLILVFLSDHYMRSAYCMFELSEIGRNAKWDSNIFRNRILPIPLEELRFDQIAVLDAFFDYWEKQEKEWEEFIQRRTGRISAGHYNRYESIKKIHQQFGELSAWLADINASKIELLSQNDFETVEQAIENRLASLKQ